MSIDQQSPTTSEAVKSPTDKRPAAKHRRRRFHWRLIVLLMVLLLTVPGVSYVRALTFPGNAGWQARSVDWVRDNGGASLVNAIENWWYTRHPPSQGAPAAAALPAWATVGPAAAPPQHNTFPTPTQPAAALAPALAPAPAAATVTAHTPQAIATLPGVAAVAGEGIWRVQRTDSAGAPALETAIFRPDSAHASVVAAAAWMPTGATMAHLVAGTREPGGNGWGGDAAVPRSDVSSLVATFNSGWRYKDISAGFYLNGKADPALQTGLASVVIDRNGQVTIGQWGRDVRMGPNVVAVRQNLNLVVEGGVPVAGLDSFAHGRWGNSKHQLEYTWRSGLGTDSAGDLIYVAGNNLTLQTLATAMTEAGIQRGMQLDIHHVDVNFAIWNQPAGGQAAATNLLPNTKAAADRYLAADQRDFFYMTLK